jgi:hypothetical protein
VQRTMRWKTYAATGPSDAYSHLVNLFAAGHGYVEFAVRLASANGDAPSILRHVDQACHYLIAVSDLLAQTGDAETVALATLAAPSRVPKLRWCAYLRTRTHADAEQLTAALGGALHCAHQAAAVMHSDGKVADVRQSVTKCIEHLELVRLLCEHGLSE